MSRLNRYVVFVVDDQQFALDLGRVKQVVNMVELISLPMAPNHVAGTINYHGTFLPVINIRKLFQLTERDVELNDQLIIVQTPKIEMALWVDEVLEMVSALDDQISTTEKVYLEFEAVKGILKLNNKMVLLSDLDQFLSADQIMLLTEAIQMKITD
ncbi:MAG: chemotaxis protein CheW [Prolixibacteraceae bacterium]